MLRIINSRGLRQIVHGQDIAICTCISVQHIIAASPFQNVVAITCV